ncbi:hypothetical protein GW796_10940 [archaeon]|nr:hypothetical protein [archaeon]
MVKILEAKDLLKSLDYVTSKTSSAETFETFKNSPIHILVYNEIKRFSKEELESCTEKTKWYSLVDYAFKNSFLLSAFIKIGAFVNQLTPESKWILNSGVQTTDFIYETIYYIEDHKRRKNREFINENEEDIRNKNTLFDFLFNHRPKDEFNLQLIEKYYVDFGKKEKEKILEFIHNNAGSNGKSSEICNFFHLKLIKDDFAFDSCSIINKFLPKNIDDSKFFISSLDILRIKSLLNYGFRFNEEQYSYNNDNLFLSVVKSGKKDIIETILPTLKNVVFTHGNQEEQNKFLKELIAKDPNKQIIESIYYKCLLDSKLPNNNENKKRIKI